MGTPRLTILDTHDFFGWVKRSGYTDENHFWSQLSGLGSGSTVDHMVQVLTSLGYTGTPNDQLAQFLKAQTGLVGGQEGTLYDMANQMFDGSYISGGMKFIDGTDFKFVDGTPFEFVE